MLASAAAPLGARFDDLTDAELLDVLAALGEDEGVLPSAEPEPADPVVPSGGG
jgi:hypothetical protein